jgi:hypothetical protein
MEIAAGVVWIKRAPWTVLVMCSTLLTSANVGRSKVLLISDTSTLAAKIALLQTAIEVGNSTV